MTNFYNILIHVYDATPSLEPTANSMEGSMLLDVIEAKTEQEALEKYLKTIDIEEKEEMFGITKNDIVVNKICSKE